MLPERQRLHGVAERADLATTRLVIVTTAVDDDLLELEVVHVLRVDFRRHCSTYSYNATPANHRRLYVEYTTKAYRSIRGFSAFQRDGII